LPLSLWLCIFGASEDALSRLTEPISRSVKKS
jgi:hypothetical protein